MAAERVNAFLSHRGVASRRAADRLVEAGRVAVNGRPARSGALVDSGDTVTVDGRPVPERVARRTVMVNKPRGVLSTRRDPGGRPTVLGMVDDPTGLAPVGRLDLTSRGLLLLTSDGELALRLTHPRHGVTKRYRVVVAGIASAATRRLLVRGVELADGPARAVEAVPAGHRGADDVLEVLMAEGRKREVRRLCAAAGLQVLDLERIAIGPLRLGRLRPGDWRRLTARELGELYAAAGLDPP
ncbi:MAG: rRNA pseudouridine synthase [Chloroflexi bacterium]|nr:MAG: rRNA pseudouridine synthase [Chloroflexota bacterium]